MRGAVVTLCAIVYTPRYFSGAAPYSAAIVGISTPRPSSMSHTLSEAPLGWEHVAACGDADQQGNGGALQQQVVLDNQVHSLCSALPLRRLLHGGQRAHGRCVPVLPAVPAASISVRAQSSNSKTQASMSSRKAANFGSPIAIFTAEPSGLIQIESNYDFLS